MNKKLHTPANIGSFDTRLQRPERFFFCIGAQKGGTTWLDKYLREHPQVCLPVHKETKYWNAIRAPHSQNAPRRVAQRLADRQSRSFVKKLLRSKHKRTSDRAWFLEHQMFQTPSKQHSGYADVLLQTYSGQPVVGDITPEYTLLDADTFDEMSQLNSDVRFVLIMRDPIDRLVSGIRHDLRVNQGLAQFSQEQLVTRLSDVVEREDPIHLGLSRYDVTIRNLEHKVPAERISYHFFESFFQEPEIERLTHHIGVSYLSAPLGKTVHAGFGQSLEVPEALQQRISDLLQDTYGFVRDKFADQVPPQWACHT